MSTKGQIVIPRAMREAAGIGAGTRLSIRLNEAGGLELKPVRTTKLEDLRGCLHRPGAAYLNDEDIRQAIMDHVAKDDARIMRSYRRGKKKP